MATTWIDNCSPYGMACTECNDVSKHEVRHVWSCENCGREIETVVNPRINALPGSNKSLASSVVT
jgi:PHP family Zn ribbon phosphoesterase